MSTEDSGDPAGALIDVGASRERASGERTQRDAGIEVGTWWWMDVEWPGTDKAAPTLVCITHIGSNYVRVSNLETRCERHSVGNELSWRVHFDNFWEELRPARDAQAYIQQQLEASQARLRGLMDELRQLAAGLMVTPMTPISGAAQTQDTSALVIASGADPKAYQQALVAAKEKTLPELYKQIEIEHKVAAAWLMTPMMALKAELLPKTKLIEAVKDRIFTVQLYAGLVEEVVQVADGAPASNDTPVHVMQQRAYMDEESLLDYDVGGMNFTRIEDFDLWLARPHNLRRVLPFDRCVIAFQVRRTQKQYEASTISEFIQTLSMREADKWTYLYIRNGEQLYRLSTGVEFDEQLFPDADKATLTNGTVYARLDSFRSTRELISEGEYLQRKQAYVDALEKHKLECEEFERTKKQRWREVRDVTLAEVRRQNRSTSRVMRDWLGHERWRLREREPKDDSEGFVRFTPGTVMYDDIAEAVAGDIKKHNRIILILQGLLDRSPCFQPHPPWQIYTDAGFAQGVRYIYDHYHAVTPGPAPDFEAFRKRLNAGITVGSVCVGQEAVWNQREREKASSRNGRDRYGRARYDYNDEMHPDPGPGRLARVARTSRGKLVFAWTRERELYRNHEWRRPVMRVVDKKLVVDPDQVLCVDNYQLGDYKQFFRDPRTRADYLQWAPLLLVAEEYKAGLRTLEDRGKREKSCTALSATTSGP